MAELQYRPNRAARALVTSRSRTIGILSSASSQYGPASSIQAIEEAAREVDYLVATANLGATDEQSIVDGLQHLTDQAVEGLVVIAPQARAFEAIAKVSLSVPFVTLQSSAERNPHALSVDQIAGARLATRHLLELGHRRIVHLAGPQDWTEAEARLNGFTAEMAAHGLAAPASLAGDWTADFGYSAGRQLLRGDAFTAVFSSNDQMALGLLHALRDAGRDVPGDISVVGFDDIPEAAHFWPPLTTVRQDFPEVGRRCIALLLDELSGASAPRPDTILPDLIVRRSTAPVRL